MNNISIDLFSDTITRPTAPMRERMCNAEVGDEQKREDPTVNQLVEHVCEILGKEDAIFLPSGTMCNQISFRVHCRQGDEIIMDKTAHPQHFEAGGPTALSGSSIYPVDGEKGIFSSDQCEAAIRPLDHYFPRSRVVSIEQTSNIGGGTIWPLKTIRDVCDLAYQRGLVTHMDGARLLNAVVATGISARDYSTTFDSVWIDFSKGLGAPIGAALAGSKAFIQEAWRWKHQFGGAMRQAGIVAAGALYALEHHIERLAEDHANAQMLANGLSEMTGITVELVETNIILFDISKLGITAQRFNELLMAKGLRMSTFGRTLLRAVTHLDVSRTQIGEALNIIHSVVQDIGGAKSS